MLVLALAAAVFSIAVPAAFASDGTFVRAFNASASGQDFGHGPWGVALDSVGNVYVADVYNSRIVKFASDGTYLAAWPVNVPADPTPAPWEVAVDHAGGFAGRNAGSVLQLRARQSSDPGFFA